MELEQQANLANLTGILILPTATFNSYSIVYDNIWLKFRVPILLPLIFNFLWFFFHELDYTQQLLQKTTLPQCNSHTMVGSHIRIYMTISLSSYKCFFLLLVNVLQSRSHEKTNKQLKENIITRIKLKTLRASRGLPAFPRISNNFV